MFFKKVKKKLLERLWLSKKMQRLNAPSAAGDLVNSIKKEVRVEGNEIVGRVYTKNDHALFVEFGTGPKGKGSASIVPKGVVLQYRETPWFVNVKDFPDYKRYNLITYTVGEETFVLIRGQKAQQYHVTSSQTIQWYSRKISRHGNI
ncbi:HK97 gp10 family phage protein [Erysipelothrix sp. Poltava]|nr:HK97 gp10 family phage protein [Erysipelothrix sp. Poltava]